MRRSLLLVGLVLCARAQATPRAGKVVRVERKSHTRLGIPRYCEIRDDGSGPAGMCYGLTAPAIGALIQIVDDQRLVAEVKITESSVYQNCKQLWLVKGVLQQGDMTLAQNGRGFSVLDGGLDGRTAHRIADDLSQPSPTHRPDEHVIGSIARDAKGTDDVVFTQYLCDPQGQPTQMGTVNCLDAYSRAAGRLTRVQQTILNCT